MTINQPENQPNGEDRELTTLPGDAGWYAVRFDNWPGEWGEEPPHFEGSETDLVVWLAERLPEWSEGAVSFGFMVEFEPREVVSFPISTEAEV